MSVAGSFAAVLHQLSQIHELEINDLKQRLTQQLQENEEQKKEIQYLRQCNQRLQQAVTSAKKKIKQYKITDHENTSDETLPEGCLESPALQQAAHREDLGCTRLRGTPLIGGDHNKTCMALFESPSVDHPPSVSQEEPARHEATSEIAKDHSGKNPPRSSLESVETTAETGDDDVVIIGDDNEGVRGCHTHQSDGQEGETLHSEGMTSSESEELSSEGSGDGDDHPNTPVHLIYSHGREHGSPLADKSLPTPNRPHRSINTGRSLVRREVQGKVRYKEVSEKESLSMTRSGLVQDGGASGGTASSSMMMTQSEPVDSDCESNSSSPSLLNTSSQWRACPQSSEHLHTDNREAAMTCSLFPGTPLPPSGSTSGGGLAATTPTATSTGQVIPSSDSQLLLDISQSIPFSPELKDPFFKAMAARVVAHSGEDLCIMETSASPEIGKGKRLSTKQLTLAKRRSPNPRVVIREEDRRGTAALSQDDRLAQDLPQRNVVLATPGVKSVDHMTNGWMQPPVVQHPSDTKTRARTRPIHHSSPTSSQEDSEEVVPKKKIHLADNTERQDDGSGGREKTSLQQRLEQQTHTDNDVTRLMTGPDDVSTPSLPASLNTSHQVTTAHHADHNSALKFAQKAGLPVNYKFSTVVRKRADRDKLDGKACPDCQAWYRDRDGVYGNQREHLKHTCRHKHLHLPPDTDPRLWDISFPNTDECEELMR